jgi:hypothetical protein
MSSPGIFGTVGCDGKLGGVAHRDFLRVQRGRDSGGLAGQQDHGAEQKRQREYFEMSRFHITNP